MKCPKCNQKAQIIDSKPVDGKERSRKYQCKSCGISMYSKEVVFYTKEEHK